MTLRAVAPSVGGGGTTVTSVNGQTGDVVLDAADVGAVATVTGTMVNNTDPQNPVIESDTTKVTAVSTPNIVYRTTGAGAQSTLAYSTLQTASTLVLRDSAGQAMMATPTAASHIATKGYVDGLVRAQLAFIADATDATDVVTKFNSLLADMIAKGYMAAA